MLLIVYAKKRLISIQYKQHFSFIQFQLKILIANVGANRDTELQLVNSRKTLGFYKFLKCNKVRLEHNFNSFTELIDLHAHSVW